MEEWLEGGLSVLLVVPEVGVEEWDPGVFEIMLSVVRVILGWVGEEGRFGWEDRVKYHHISDGAIQAAGSRGRYSVFVQTIQDGCEGMIISSAEEDLDIFVRDRSLGLFQKQINLPARIPARIM